MFGGPKIQVSYNARLRRARVSFTVGEAFKSRHPPLKPLRSIKIRFEQEKEDGHIETYALFTKRFFELWSYLRSREGQIDPSRMIKMTIGQGGRLYDEIALTPPPASSEAAHAAAPAGDEKVLALFSCSLPQKRIQTIPFNAFVFNVILKLQHLKISAPPDRAQLRFIYLLLKNGQTLSKIELRAQPDFAAYGKPLLVKLDPQKHYATLHIFDPRCLLHKSEREQTWKRALLDLNRLNRQKLDLTLLKDHSLEKLESIAAKGQGFGFMMPYDLLIAYEAGYRLDDKHLKAEKAMAQHEQADLPRWKMRLGAKPSSEFFQVEISSDGMSAKVAVEHKPALARVKSSMDLEWLARELEKQEISQGYEPFLEGLWQSIQSDRSLVGSVVAKGTPPEAGTSSYLHMLLGDGKDMKAQRINMRESQNPRLAREGEIVAEMRYVDGKPGVTVRGIPIHALASASSAQIAAGDGIGIAHDARFFAKRDGIVKVEGKLISCEKAYVHKGSINLSSGDLAFEGSVVVQGDIDSGASVSVRGSLIVEGMIGASQVFCTGSIDVKGGIVSGVKGWVHAGGAIRCGFIENSEVQARGGLSVQRSIMHSTVIAHGPIAIADQRRGVIAGGSVSSWTSIQTAQCGMAEGSSTECRIGSDFNAERRLKRAKNRRYRMMLYTRQIEKGIKDFQAHPKSAPDALHAFELLRKRHAKAERITKKLQVLSEHLEHRMVWNADATLTVTGVLEKTLHLTAAGKRIPLTENLRSVCVMGTAIRGSHVIDLDELQAMRASAKRSA